jgi:hypothetical protein
MAECLDQRQAPDIPRLASEGFSVALAIEIEASRQATIARRGPNRVARASAAISRQEDTMKTHRIAGGAGVQLHMVETGNPQGRPILFIHGASQCWLQWNRQMNSSLRRSIDWSLWICEVVVSRTSRTMATTIQSCGRRTSTRSSRRSI